MRSGADINFTKFKFHSIVWSKSGMLRADAALVCIATPLADARSIELTTSARSGTFGAMGVVA
jgi:hypothetical protein